MSANASSPPTGAVLLSVDSLARAFTRGRSGYRDDLQSAVVCAELRRLVTQGELPRACWEPIRSAVYGTHMDSWSSGLPVDERYEALWPLFESGQPLLADANSAAVDPEVAVAAVEYGVTVLDGHPRVVRRIPAEHDPVLEVWNGAAWAPRPDAAFGRSVSGTEALRVAGMPRPDTFG